MLDIEEHFQNINCKQLTVKFISYMCLYDSAQYYLCMGQALCCN